MNFPKIDVFNWIMDWTQTIKHLSCRTICVTMCKLLGKQLVVLMWRVGVRRNKGNLPKLQKSTHSNIILVLIQPTLHSKQLSVNFINKSELCQSRTILLL